MKRFLAILCVICLLLSFGGCKQEVDERTLPVWELKISDEAKLEFMWCYAKAYPSTVGFELAAYNVDSLSQLWDAKVEAATQNHTVGFRYYGTFGDCIVWRSGSTQSSWSDFEIAGYAFEDVDVNCLNVCREGELLNLTMAYAMGYISAEDVGIVCQRHKDYVDHYFTDTAETTTAPTETTAPEQETTLAAQSQFPPEPEPELGSVDAQEEYGHSFVYHIGEDPADGYYEYYLQLDVSLCEDGYLYRYNRHTKELLCILDEPVAMAVPCGFGYLYVPEDNRQTVLWTDANGEDSIPVYNAQYGDVSRVCWFADQDNTNIYILEDNSYILELYDLNLPPRILFEDEGITAFSKQEDYLWICYGEEEYHLHEGMDEPVKLPCPHHWEEMSEPLVAELTQLLAYSTAGGHENWHNFALKSTYETAADVDLLQLFYSAPWRMELTQEEKDFLTEKGMDIDTSIVHKYPVEKMNEVLTEIFGITLEQTNGVGLEKMVYNPDTNSYYHLHGDFWAVVPTVLKGTVLYDGKLVINYTGADASGQSTEKAVTLQYGEGGTYIILSNEVVQ